MKEEHPKFKLIWSANWGCDSIWSGDATDEELRDMILDHLVENQTLLLMEGNFPLNPHDWTEEQRYQWDSEYYDTTCYAVKYDPSVPETSKYSCGDGYVEYDVVTYEDEKRHGILDYEDYCKEYDGLFGEEREGVNEVPTTN